MRALILAAGRGTRISRYLSGNPKCTVDIGEISLIENTIKQLNLFGVEKIGVILGYNDNVIREILKDYNVDFFYNPFYDITNSIASAWFASEFISEEDDMIIMNGDVYLEDSLLKDILIEKSSPVLFCDTSRKEEADYKLYFEKNILMKYGKELSGADISGEYIGVAKINKDFINTFKEGLNSLINNQQHSLWWENILYSMIGNKKIYVKEIGNKFWAEVDYIEDYERILKFRKYSIQFSIDVKKI